LVDFRKLKKPYLIAEIGINHNGDLQIAKKLIDATFACSWDCAKFQKRNPDIAVPEKQKNVMRDTPWGKMTYIDYKHKIEFGKKEYDYINKYCKEKPIDWSVSVWDMDSLEFSMQYNLSFLKIPSAMLTNHKLLAASAKSGIPILISTGMSTLKEIDESVNLLEKYSKSYAVMHCNSSYPAKLDELNLKVIMNFKERYNCVVGYSGHEYDLEPTVLAVSLGAMVIERHITLSHNMWGTDQKASLEIHAMDMLRKRLLDIDIILGSREKTVTVSEIPIRERLRG
jgi:N-acetylneuraminate synthase